jgi:NTE family protein
MRSRSQPRKIGWNERPEPRALSQTPPAGPSPKAGVNFNESLAIPIPADPSPGKGKDRALVLGGGGEYFAAWMLDFFYGLHTGGVPYEAPDVVVGTSAGSLVGSTIVGGHLERLTKEFDSFGRFPTI